MPSLFIDYVLYVDHLTKRLSQKNAFQRKKPISGCAFYYFVKLMYVMRKTVKSVKKNSSVEFNIWSIRARLEILN